MWRAIVQNTIVIEPPSSRRNPATEGKVGTGAPTAGEREREREREREERKKREKKMGGDDGASVACDDGIVARLGALEVHT
jgi:hypothetical protein